MRKLAIELDESTYDKIERLTKTHHCQVSNLVQTMAEQLTKTEVMNDSSIGKWSDDAELVDKIIAEIAHNGT